MSPRLLALACCVALLLWSSQYLADPGGVRDGQIVFIRAQEIGPEVPGSRPSPLSITGCVQTPEGLEVRGMVSQGGGTVSVAVTGGDPTVAGTAVGAGFLTNSGQDPTGQTGSFALTLEWADRASTFAVLGPGTAGVQGAPAHLGESTACPGG